MTAQELAERTEGAYSSGRYRSWKAVARLLLKRGYTPEEAEAIMRSKWTRWAADYSDARDGCVPAKAVAEFLDSYKDPDKLKRDVAGLVAGTL